MFFGIHLARSTRSPVFTLAFLFLLNLFLPGRSVAQSCTSSNPCILAIGNSFGYAHSTLGCTADYIDYYNKRFLRDHFDNGTPGDRSDDPVSIAFSAWTNVFGNMADVNDPMSLPSTENLARAVAAAQANDTPFLLHIGQWGCQHECFARTSATVSHLRSQDENWMQSPDGDLGFQLGNPTPWCALAYTFTYSLHPEAGLAGADGLQVLFERNVRHIASWIADNIIAVPAVRKHLVGVVTAAETHYGPGRWGSGYEPPMIDGFRDFVEDQFGCAKQPTVCLTEINQTYGTSFATLEEVYPPTGACTAGTSSYCQDWDFYRTEVLHAHLERVADLFVEEGVPSSYLFGHDLVGASGGLLGGPILLPNRQPGRTAYATPLGSSGFEAYAGCTSGASGNCREWAIVEGFMDPPSCGDPNNLSCYDADLERMFDLNASFFFLMRRSLNGTELLGSRFEQGIHKWAMRYSDAYTLPQADVTFNAATDVVSGCVYDLDSVWRGRFTQIGGKGTEIDANDINVRVTVSGQPPITTSVEVADNAPWCGAGGINFSLSLSGLTGAESILVEARDYPTDTYEEVFCWQCDDGEIPLMYVDRPSHLETVSGNFLVSGWATDASGVASLTFQVDGTPVTLSGFQWTSRPSVCSIHPLGDPNCPNVGFQGTLDTTVYSNGQHILKATATDPFGNAKVFNRTFNTANQTETDPPLMYVDRPSHLETVSGNFLVSGWATDASGVASLTFQVDGTPVTLSGFQWTSRPSVCSVHPLGDPNCPNVGFRGTLDTTVYSNGPHVLKVTATDPFSNTKVFNRSFVILN